MARLTRTQKFADLREQLANDKETSVQTQDLSSYQNRLNNIQDTLVPNIKEEIVEPVVEQLSKPVAPVVETKSEATKTLDEIELSVEDLYADVFNDVIDSEGEAVNKKERDTYLDQAISDANNHNANSGLKTINEIIEESVNDVRHPEVIAPVVEEFKANIEAEKPAIQSDEYFTEPVVEKPAVEAKLEPTKTSDEDFSNTVSLEISKIIDDIAAEPVEPVAVTEVPEIKVAEEKVAEVLNAEPEVEKDVVEIKNINELKESDAHDTISETIPFVVNSEDEDDIEEDDEDGSNVVLNVILIVLIIILVAVLGLIVFYILKTKSII